MKVHELTTPKPDLKFYYKRVFAKAYYGSQLELTATQLSTQHLLFGLNLILNFLIRISEHLYLFMDQERLPKSNTISFHV